MARSASGRTPTGQPPAALAALFAALVARTATGTDRKIAVLVALGALAWFIGQFAWVVQTALGFFQVPAPSDVGFLLLTPPIIVAFVVAVYGRLSKAEEIAVYLDSAAIFLAITAIILAMYGDGHRARVVAGAVAVAYPIVHLATAAAGLVALLAVAALARGGGYLLLVGFAILGFAWVAWLQARRSRPAAGRQPRELLLLGRDRGRRGRRRHVGARRGHRDAVSRVTVGLGARRSAAGGPPRERHDLAVRHVVSSELGSSRCARFAVILLAGVRQSLLVHERGRLLEESTGPRDELEVALDPASRGRLPLPRPRRARPGGGLHRRRRTRTSPTAAGSPT